jgi:mono/diheme cytochrome c family protein
VNLRPAPRDFRLGPIEFAAVASGRLPNDEDLVRVIRRGLPGTAMHAWAVPERELDPIVQYLKTFSPRWRREAPGARVVATADPWSEARRAEAVRRGEAVYHVVALCTQCHPAYATRARIDGYARELLGAGMPEFRADLYGAVARPTDWGTVILPTDFLRQELRGGESPEDVYRALACGVGGTAMAGWRDVLPEEDLWAMVHYVRSLAAMRGTAAADEVRRGLAEQERGAESRGR